MSKATMKKAIKEKCLECMCGQIGEVRSCELQRCPLWEYRLGKDPYVAKREYSEEQKKAMRERLANLSKTSHK